MLVYVINKDGQPLMPTKRFGKVRRLLKSNKAKCIKRCPFTIQLKYETGAEVQEVSLGVDAGSKHIGLSATTEKEVLFEADVQLRNDIVDLLSTRRELRQTRRGRKTRYRQARFNNRVSAKKEGWLAPSVKHKVQTHLDVVEKVCKILPVSKIVVEVASFDIQKIKNPNIKGEEYQHGEIEGFWNVREYVLWRDGYICQCCKGKSKDKILNVHHIESRKVGGDAPNNLITLCETCHTGYHKGELELPKKIKRGMKFNDATFMGVMRWAFYNKLKENHPNVSLTYGYKTKSIRIENNLSKEHYIDARCISGNPQSQSSGEIFYISKKRCHNRQLHKANPSKGGVRKANQAPYIVKGFRLWDKVKYNNQECFVTGRRQTGMMTIKTFDGEMIKDGIIYKKLILLETGKHYITERRVSNSSTWLKLSGSLA